MSRDIYAVRLPRGKICIFITIIIILALANKVRTWAAPPVGRAFLDIAAPAEDLERIDAVATSKDRMAVRHPRSFGKLRGGLLDLVDHCERFGAARASEFGVQKRLGVVGDQATVILTPSAGVSLDDLKKSLGASNAALLRVGENHLKVRVPIASLIHLAGTAQIGGIQTPVRPKPNTVSEGVAAMNIPIWHSVGRAGAGVKVAVVDGGFIGLAAAQAAGELPANVITRDESGTGLETDTSHGVGVAEIVHEMAPAAQLYLIKIADNSDLEAAKNYCKANGIQVVNHSMGWYGLNYYDGAAYATAMPSPVATVNDAYANDILWVNSAGNDRSSHALTQWTDSNSDNSMDWAPTSVGSNFVNQIGWYDVGEVVDVALTWNAWPSTNQDFDLWLRRWTGSSWTTVASSSGSQTGTQAPVEGVFGYSVTTGAYYGVTVRKYSANTSPTFILRILSGGVQYFSYNNSATPVAGSIGCPADAQSALAVGAIPFGNYLTGPIEWFSSIGPNNGAYTGQPSLAKPNVCGPDATASWTYSGGFYGTSASSPHVAGLACVLRGSLPSYTAAQIRSYIESHGVDLGSPGFDNEYGSGAVVLPETARSDYNCDGHVDSLDFDFFSDCYNGPVNLVTGSCLKSDFNADQHVDAIDFDTFSACYNGPVNPPGC